jgi:hypothetical protein
LNSNSYLKLGASSTLTAGVLGSVPVGNLSKTNITSSGSVLISAAKVTAGLLSIGSSSSSQSKITATGGNVQFTNGTNVKDGIQLGNSLLLQDNGGSVTAKSGGTVSGSPLMIVIPQVNGTVTTGGVITLSATATTSSVSLGNSSSLTALTASLTGPAVALGNGDTIATSGNLTITSNTNLSVGFGDTLSAGSLAAGAPSTGILTSKSQIASSGAVNLGAGKLGGTLTINSGAGLNQSTITANGANVSISNVFAKTGNIVFGDDLHVAANGGSVIMLGGGTVTGGLTPTFSARSVSTSATVFSGGGVEISAGMTVDTSLTTTLARRPTTLLLIPNPLTGVLSNFTLNNNGSRGEVKANVTTGGSVSIGTLLNGAVLNIQNGVIFLNGVGKGLTIQGAQIEADAPVALVEESSDDIVIDTSDDFDCAYDAAK